MTRNTKLHVFTSKGKKILFRDLTVEELAFLKGIKSDANRCEIAGKLALYNSEDKNIGWAVLMQIGQNAIDKSESLLDHQITFEMTLRELRESVDKDVVLVAIGSILKVLPGQSITDLLKLTMKDLLEIVVICEKITGSVLIDTNVTSKKPTMKLADTSSLSPEQNKSLRQQIAKLNSKMGIQR